jgi:putative ABC transport system permease protein
LWQDIRHAVRLLRNNPGFTLVAVLALSLGIGATSAIFSVVNAVLLRPFPYEDSDRLVVVWERNLNYGLPFMVASAPNYVDWREQNQVFAGLGAFQTRGYFLEHDGEALRLYGARMTSSVFSMLGVAPLVGRAFNAGDEGAGVEPVALLSHRIWRARYGGDPGVIGQTIVIDERSYTVVGVMPPGFNFPPPIVEGGIAKPRTNDLWVPFESDLALGNRGARNLTVLARLANGVGAGRAEAEMNAIAGRLEREYPETNAGWDVTLVPLDEQVVGGVKSQLLILLGAVGFVLLIACVNVANLLLARGTARRREFAVRAALGAGRARLVRQLLTEGLMLALMGGAFGLLLATLGMETLVRLAPQNVPRLDQTGLDLPVIAFTLSVSILTGALFALAPAFGVTSANMGQQLREGGRSQAEGRAAARLRSVLVVSEIALSLVLLVGAGLLFQSFLRLRYVPVGFEAENALTMRLTLSRAKYPEDAERVAAYAELERRLNGVAGVQAAGFIYDIPLASDRGGTSFDIEGELTPPSDESRIVNISSVTPGYFQAMGVPLLQGRYFLEADNVPAEKVIIINRSLARRFFSVDEPLGTRLVVHGDARRIVGVVEDVRHNTLRDDPNPSVYLPYYQYTNSRSLSLIARSEIPAEAMLATLREEIREFDAGLPVYEVKTMQQVMGESMARMRFSTLMLAVFSGVALLLAAVGIYGVISYSVSRRTQETGIRMALGARSADILTLVVGQGLRLASIGVVVGLAASFALARTLSGLLYGVSASDALTFVAVALLLMGIAMLACYVPARRATRVDPMVALRYE